MKLALVALLAIVAGTNTQSAQDAKGLLTFEGFRVAADLVGRPANPLIVTPLEHTYRTTIRKQAARGPNFAGHFTLAKWGCGSPCLKFVIIDAETGMILDPGLTVGCADKNGLDAKLDFKLTSRLVKATGFSEKDGCGTNFYEWNGKRLARIGFRSWPASGP